MSEFTDYGMTFSTKRYEAWLEKVSAQMATDHIQLLDMRLGEYEDVVRRQLVHSLTGYVLAGAPTEVRFHWSEPMNWREHWKRDVWLKWCNNPSTPLGEWLFTRALRVRNTEHSETRTVSRAICPHGLIATKDRHLEWLAAEIDKADWL